MFRNKGPKIEWLEPGEDPTTTPYVAQRPHLSGCLRIVVLAIAFLGLIVFVIGRSRSAASPKPAITGTVQATKTPVGTHVRPTATDYVRKLPPLPTEWRSPTPTTTSTPAATMTLAPTTQGMTIYSAQLGDYGVPTVTCQLYQGKDRQRCQRAVATYHAELTKVPQVKKHDPKNTALPIPANLPEATTPTFEPGMEFTVSPTPDHR
jgi:hypothetical protein